MISVRVKTQSLEVAVSSQQDPLNDVVKAVISVAESEPVQSSLQAPIIIKPLEAPKENQRQLPLFEEQEEKEYTERKQRLPSGKGERVVAYNKTRELIERNFFESGKSMKDIRQELAKIGYTISTNKLSDALLMLVRDGLLTREGERRSYTYKKPDPDSDKLSK